MAIAAVLLCGCASPPSYEQPAKVTSFQQAGLVRIAPLSVARWDDYVNALQAQFTLSADDAVKLAVPRTSISQSGFADILGGSGQVGLPQSVRTSSQSQTASNGSSAGDTSSTSGGATTTTSTTSTNGTTTTTQNTTTQQNPGTLPASLFTPPAAANAATLPTPSGTVVLDPILTYTAASAIYQEVQLLNRYLKDAALRYGAVPYLARVQISVEPHARNEVLDTDLDLGMFAKCRGLSDEAPVMAIPLLVTDDVEAGQATDALKIARQLALSLGGISGDVAYQAGLSSLQDRFNAILSTEYNSLFMVSRGADNVIHVRIGAARSPNVKVGYSMLTQTHNLTFVLLVDQRFAPGRGGACFRGDAAEGMPDHAPQVRIVSYSRFRDAIKGAQLDVDVNLVDEQEDAIASRFGIDIKDRSARLACVDTLAGAVQAFDFEQFRCELDALDGDDGHARSDHCEKNGFSREKHTLQCPKSGGWPVRGGQEALWTELATVLEMIEYASTNLELPGREPPPVMDELDQAVFLHDNCKDGTTVTIPGFGSFLPSQFTAEIGFKTGLKLASTAIAQASPGAPFTLQFPSLQPLAGIVGGVKDFCAQPPAAGGAPKKAGGGAAAPASATAHLKSAGRLDGVVLVVREVADRRWAAATGDDGDQYRFAFQNVFYDGTGQTDISLSLTAGVDTIMANSTGAGTLRLFLKPGKDLSSVSLAFSGASLDSLVQPQGLGSATLTQNNGGLKFTPGAGAAASVPIVIDVNLSGVVAGRTLSVTASGQKAGASATVASSTVALPIVQLAPSTKTAPAGSP